MEELHPYFSVHPRKMSSYHWCGVWMNEDGSILRPLSVETPEKETMTCVGEIKDVHYTRAKEAVAELLWKGGFRPGDSPDKARQILESSTQAANLEVVEED